MDLVLGTVIILSLLGGAYALSSYYSSLNQAAISSGDLNAQFSSAVTSFMLVNSTRAQILDLQSGGSATTFLDYVQQTLGSEVSVPYSVTVYALEDYATLTTPTVQIFSYTSSGFSSSRSVQSFYEPIIVTNSTSLCGSACNFSLGQQSVFPTQNLTVNAPQCSALNNNLYPTGWDVFNNTPVGSCTITVGSYFVDGLPNNYLIDAYSSTDTYEGNVTDYVLGLDLVVIKLG